MRELATHLVGDHHRAEDLAQDTLLAALRGDGLQRGSTSYFKLVARHVLTDQLRAEGTRRARERQAGRRDDPIEGPLDAALRNELESGLIAAVEALPTRYRAPVLLKYYEGLDTAEIAAVLSIPFETARTRLRRGLLRLSSTLRGGMRERGIDYRSALLVLAGGSGGKRGATAQASWLLAASVAIAFLVVAASFGRARLDAGPLVRAGEASLEEAQQAALWSSAGPAAPRTALLVDIDVEVLVERTAAPLPGAQLTATWDGGSANAATDARGRARLRVPRSGERTLRVEATDRTQAEVERFEGEPRATCTLLVQPLRTLSGTVRDEDGRPVAGARVQARWVAGAGPAAAPDARSDVDRERRAIEAVRGDGSAPQAALAVRTDADGGWVLAGLPAAFWVDAGDERGRIVEHVLVAQDLAPGEQQGLDLVLVPARALRGRVVDAHGAPLAGAQVFAQPRGFPGVGAAGARAGFLDRWEVARTVADEEGRFELSGLAANRSLRVAARSSDGSSVAAAAELARGGDVHDLVLAARAAVQVEVLVLDERGGPLVGARVQLLGAALDPASDGELLRRAKRPLHTDAAGRVTFADRHAGEPFGLLVDAAGMAPRIVAPLCAPAERATFTVRLVASAPLAGRVLDANGPVADALVRVRPVLEAAPGAALAPLADPDRESLRALLFGRFAAQWLGVCRTDAGGRFTVAGAAGEVYDVEVLDERHGRIALVRTALGGGETTLALPADLRPVTVQVRDDASGAPLRDAVLTLIDAERNLAVAPVPDGAGGFAARLPQGDWLLVAECPGYASWLAPVDCESTALAVELRQACSARLVLPRVEDAAADAWLEVADEHGRAVPLPVSHGRRRTRVPVDGGAIELAGLPRGPIAVRLISGGSQRVHDAFASDGALLDLTLERGLAREAACAGRTDYALDAARRVVVLYERERP